MSTASSRYDLPPLLLLAIMINESTMDEQAVRLTARNGALYAKDGGLMGLRCVLDRQGRCKNAFVRGMSWAQVAEPTTNIAIAARELAYWRDAGGVASRKVYVRDAEGVRHAKVRLVRCPHGDHPFWAHYNHGTRYIDHGPARTYPARVAALYSALSQTVGQAPAPTRLLTTFPHGTSHGGLGPREQSLRRKILDVGPVCNSTTTAQLEARD